MKHYLSENPQVPAKFGRGPALQEPRPNDKQFNQVSTIAMRWITLSFFFMTLAAEPVTFNKHIAPVIFQYCSPCHRPGEAAPFSLLNYADAHKHASQIAAVTERRYMPPWLP